MTTDVDVARLLGAEVAGRMLGAWPGLRVVVARLDHFVEKRQVYVVVARAYDVSGKMAACFAVEIPHHAVELERARAVS